MYVDPVGNEPPNPAYAPHSPSIRSRSAVILPSEVRPSSAYCTWPRPCIESIASLRVSVHFTARPSFTAASATAPWSGPLPALPPNAPPTCGATTRTWSFSRPRVSASRSRDRCGCWVEIQIVTTSPSPPGSTTIALPSIGAVAMRWLTIRTRTTWSAPSNGSERSLPCRRAATFVPISSNWRGASSASAASRSLTAGSWS